MKPTYVLGLVGSLITLTLLFELLRRRRLREKYAVFWVIVATATLVIALFPATLTAAADLVGVAVPANLLFFGASMLLLGVSIHQSYEMGRLEERTRTLAEEIGCCAWRSSSTRTAAAEPRRRHRLDGAQPGGSPAATLRARALTWRAASRVAHRTGTSHSGENGRSPGAQVAPLHLLRLGQRQPPVRHRERVGVPAEGRDVLLGATRTGPGA